MFIVKVYITTSTSKPPVKLVTEYNSWSEADTVYAQWLALYQLGNNPVSYVELVEETKPTMVKSSEDTNAKQI
jgi:hypothetical protein